MDKNRIFLVTFIAGVSLLVLSSAIALVQGEFTPVTAVMLVLGALACVFYAVIKKDDVVAVFTNRATRYGINAMVYTILVIAIIVAIQAIFTINSAQLDLTKNRKHTLSDETVKTLKSLKTEINSYYFFSISSRNGMVEDTLKRYAQINPKFKTESIDADKNPAFAKRFSVDRYGIVVFSRKDTGAFEKIDQLSEEGLTNGLLRMARGDKKKIYFTKGHGEPAIDGPVTDKLGFSVFANELKAYNYDVQPVELFSGPLGVPEDCALLVVAGGRTDLFDAEMPAIRSYLRRGGKILFFLTAFANTPNIDSLARSYGIVLHNDVVVDKMGRMFGGDVLTTIISSYEQHELTKGFGMATFFPASRTFEIKGGVEGVVSQPVARTNPGSWGETDLAGVQKGTASQDKSDLASPLPVAAAINIDNAMYKDDGRSNTVNTQARMVLLGSTGLASNAFLNASGNKDFVLNTVNWLAESGDMIAIRPKDNSFEPLFLSKIQGRMLFTIPTVFLPLLIAALGIMVFVRRKRS